MKPTQLTSVVYPISFNPETNSYVHTIRIYMIDEVGNLYVANPNDENGPKWLLNVESPEVAPVKGVQVDLPKQYLTDKPSPLTAKAKKSKQVEE